MYVVYEINKDLLTCDFSYHITFSLSERERAREMDALHVQKTRQNWRQIRHAASHALVKRSALASASSSSSSSSLAIYNISEIKLSTRISLVGMPSPKKAETAGTAAKRLEICASPTRPTAPKKNLSFASEGQKEIPKIFPHFLKKKKKKQQQPRQKKAAGCSGCYSYLFMASSYALPRSLSFGFSLFHMFECVCAMKHMLHLPPSVVDELHYMAAATAVSTCIHTYSHTHTCSKRDRVNKNKRGRANARSRGQCRSRCQMGIHLLLLFSSPGYTVAHTYVSICCCSSRIDTNSICIHTRRPFV